LTQIVNGIHLPDHDMHFREQILNNPIVDGKGTYQYGKLSKSIELCKSRRFAIDVGAHVGLWTRILVNQFDQVAAIEPLPTNVQCLILNVGDDCDNIDIFVNAISLYNGNLSLKIGDNIATASVCAHEDSDIEVPCKPLDDFNFVDVDFIKIDVEGYENNVIKSGEFTIRKYKPVIVVEQKKRTIKYDGYKFAAVSTLASWGMDIAWENHGDICLIWR